MTDVHSVSQTPLLFLTFLQQRPCANSKLQSELENLHCELELAAQCGLTDHIVYPQDSFSDSNIECDGELQTDGHSIHRGLLNDVPQVDLVLPGIFYFIYDHLYIFCFACKYVMFWLRAKVLGG